MITHSVRELGYGNSLMKNGNILRKFKVNFREVHLVRTYLVTKWRSHSSPVEKLS